MSDKDVLTGEHFIQIRVLDEIPPTRFAEQSAADLADMVREVIAAEVAEHRAVEA